MSTYRQIGRPAPVPDKWWATELTDEIGPTAAANEIGISRGTLACVIAGLPVSATTVTKVRKAKIRFARSAA